MSTTIHVQNSGTYNNGSHFDLKDTFVKQGGKITLNAKGNSDIDVYTYQGEQLVNVFENATPPYKAKPNGNTHTLLSSITGTIMLSLVPQPSNVRDDYTTTTSNGTINVGGGSNGDGDDDDDDGNG